MQTSVCVGSLDLVANPQEEGQDTDANVFGEDTKLPVPAQGAEMQPAVHRTVDLLGEASHGTPREALPAGQKGREQNLAWMVRPRRLGPSHLSLRQSWSAPKSPDPYLSAAAVESASPEQAGFHSSALKKSWEVTYPGACRRSVARHFLAVA